MSEREFRFEVEVEGTPEEVWEAIATGPGISSWLQKTEVDPQAGSFSFDMGLGSPRTGRITAWNPPSRFGQAAEWGADDRRTLATEWTIEAVAGNRCRVRVVVSGFGSSDAWDDEVDAFSASMREGMRHLARKRREFGGAIASGYGAWGRRPGSPDEALGDLLAVLGAVDGEVSLADPELVGAVEVSGREEVRRDAIARLERPAPGYALASAFSDLVHVQVFLFGSDAEALAAEQAPRLRALVSEHFPVPYPDQGEADA